MTLLLDAPSALLAVMTALLTPLALRLARLEPLWRLAIPAGVIAAASAWLEPGLLAVIFVAPYATVCAVAGLVGARRLLRAPWPPAALARHAALVILAGACVWLVAYRANIPLLGYPPLWVLLTAAHFHVAGAYLATVIGTVARDAVGHVIALGCDLGLPLTALGILLTGPLETVAALVMATSAFAAGVYLLVHGRGLVRAAGLPLAAGMVLAMLYALRAHGTAITIGDLDPLSSMIASHAVLDTAFAALALLGLALGQRSAADR